MSKPLDRLSLSGSDLAELFPFHLLISNSEPPALINAGRAIAKSLPSPLNGQLFFDEFSVKRPRLMEQTATAICQSAGKLMVLQHANDQVKLRGQFVANSSDTLLFLGSLLINASDSLQVSGFTLRDFAAFDNTPELLILHQFREMQIRDLNGKSVQLSKTIQSRDDFNQRANTDALTGIANRRGFLEHCNAHLNTSAEGSVTAVLLIDLDRFKSINDNFGHEAGDAVLSSIATRLSEALQGRGHAGRLGGDEFAVIATFEDSTAIEPFARELRQQLLQPIQYRRNQLNVGLSIGVAAAGERETTQRLLHKADMAMYAGRKHQSGTITCYSAELQADIDYRKQLEQALEAAIEQRHIKPHFQPIINLQDHTLEGFETLARWHHPTLGPISPIEFIQTAEDIGLLVDLDWMMIEQALDQLQQWHKAGQPYILHVNVSAPTLNENLASRIAGHLQRRDLPPGALILELTETSLLGDADTTLSVLNAVTEVGVGLQLDDFGTGYSALTHLLHFPVTGVKLDRSYIKAASESEKARKLLKALIDMSNTLGISTVGEGVETQRQSLMLAEAGCRFGQGYLLGKPMSAADVENMQLLGKAA